MLQKVDFGRSSQTVVLKNGILQVKTAPRHPSPNGLVKRSVRIFKDGMKKWAHGRLRVSYLFVRWIAPVTRTLQLFHATTLILNRIISTSLTNSFPARANTWMLQKSRDSSRHFRVSQLVKSCTSLTSSSIKQCGVSLWLSQVEIFLPNEQASETVDSRLRNAARCATRLYCARLSREENFC